MISLKLLLEGRYDYGCLMGIIDEEISRKILDFNYNLIEDKHLYKDGKNYGREHHPHVTIKYGFTKSYTEKQMKKMLGKIKPFKVKVTEIDIFENDKCDVIILNIKSDVLEKLNKKFSELPNEDEYPNYKPHITLAYVKKGTGKKFIKNSKTFSNVPIKYIQYSDKGEKTFYNL
jgi:2'-5' RNA ligase